MRVRTVTVTWDLPTEILSQSYSFLPAQGSGASLDAKQDRNDNAIPYRLSITLLFLSTAN
jgi:hypothetical protein